MIKKTSYLHLVLDNAFSQKQDYLIKNSIRQILYLMKKNIDKESLYYIHEYIVKNSQHTFQKTLFSLLKNSFFTLWTKQSFTNEDTILLKHYFPFFSIKEQTIILNRIKDVVDKTFIQQLGKVKEVMPLTAALKEARLKKFTTLKKYIQEQKEISNHDFSRIEDTLIKFDINNDLGEILIQAEKKKNKQPNHVLINYFNIEHTLFKNYIQNKVDWHKNNSVHKSTYKQQLDYLFFIKLFSTNVEICSRKEVGILIYSSLIYFFTNMKEKNIEPQNFIKNFSWFIEQNYVPFIQKISKKWNIKQDVYYHLVKDFSVSQPENIKLFNQFKEDYYYLLVDWDNFNEEEAIYSCLEAEKIILGAKLQEHTIDKQTKSHINKI